MSVLNFTVKVAWMEPGSCYASCLLNTSLKDICLKGPREWAGVPGSFPEEAGFLPEVTIT